MERTKDDKVYKVYKIYAEIKDEKPCSIYCLEHSNSTAPSRTMSDLAMSIERQGLVGIVNQIPTEIDVEVRRDDAGQPYQVLHYSPLSEKEMRQLHKELAKCVLSKAR